MPYFFTFIFSFIFFKQYELFFLEFSNKLHVLLLGDDPCGRKTSFADKISEPRDRLFRGRRVLMKHYLFSRKKEKRQF